MLDTARLALGNEAQKNAANPRGFAAFSILQTPIVGYPAARH